MPRRVLSLALLLGCVPSRPPEIVAAGAPSPADPSALLQAASQAYDHQDWTSCADLFQRAARPYDAACCLARGGEQDRALATLDVALNADVRQLEWALQDPDLQDLRADPRGAALLQAAQPRYDAWLLTVNAELRALYQADQADRANGTSDHGHAEIATRDQARRARAAAILAEGGAQVAEDYFHAALIFQHGDTVHDIETARDLALQAVALDPDNDTARWLVAAATDRALMYQELPQKYGTQFRTEGGRWVLYAVDPAVTDAERALWGVPPLAEARRRAEALNQAP